ncbi:MAG: L-threonylcarbamoyladenylate synthase [Candidatus Korarchaeota archaeon]
MSSKKPLILRISPVNPELDKIRIAADIIRKGGLVIFPTETVYGLGANAFNEHAVRRIFEVKGRPQQNPLLVHIANKEWVYKLAEDVPEDAELLIKKFWPGPLALVLKRRKGAIPDIVTAGLDTVGLRMPSHGVALALISEAGVPIVAPSANRYDRPSPTKVEHIIDELSAVDCIIDSGQTFVGLESTILDLTLEKPTILRPGVITKEMIEEVLGKEVVYSQHPAPAFWALDRRYNLRSKLYLVVGEPSKVRARIKELVNEFKGKKIAVVVTEENFDDYGVEVHVIGSRNNLIEVARNIFDIMRKLESSGYTLVIFEGFEEVGLAYSIMQRLKKAATAIIRA